MYLIYTPLNDLKFDFRQYTHTHTLAFFYIECVRMHVIDCMILISCQMTWNGERYGQKWKSTMFQPLKLQKGFYILPQFSGTILLPDRLLHFIYWWNHTILYLLNIELRVLIPIYIFGEKREISSYIVFLWRK